MTWQAKAARAIARNINLFYLSPFSTLARRWRRSSGRASLKTTHNVTIKILAMLCCDAN
jgi:hypothetical protein